MPDITTNLPDINCALILPNGQLHPVWFQFFLRLLTRTEAGNNPEINHLTILLNALYGQEASQVESGQLLSAMKAIQGVALAQAGQAPAHGVQYDEQLHALATTALAGFMSAADKLKLDGIGGGAAVQSVTATYPIQSSGGAVPDISIQPATAGLAGSLSAADKSKLDQLVYDPNTWTPTLSFDVPGNLNVVYSTRVGIYTRIARQILLQFYIATSTFTWTTSTGNLIITGVPFTPTASLPEQVGVITWTGLSMPGFMELVPRVLPAAPGVIQFVTAGSGTGRSVLNTTSTTSGTNIFITGTISFTI